MIVPLLVFLKSACLAPPHNRQRYPPLPAELPRLRPHRQRPKYPAAPRPSAAAYPPVLSAAPRLCRPRAQHAKRMLRGAKHACKGYDAGLAGASTATCRSWPCSSWTANPWSDESAASASCLSPKWRPRRRSGRRGLVHQVEVGVPKLVGTAIHALAQARTDLARWPQVRHRFLDLVSEPSFGVSPRSRSAQFASRIQNLVDVENAFCLFKIGVQHGVANPSFVAPLQHLQ